MLTSIFTLGTPQLIIPNRMYQNVLVLIRLFPPIENELNS